MRVRRYRLAAALTAVIATLGIGLATPVPAAATTAGAGECTLSIQLGFTPNLTATVQTNLAISAVVSLSSCEPAVNNPLPGLNGGSMRGALASCEAMTATGIFQALPDLVATMVQAGTTQVWEFQSQNPQTVGAAVMDWTNVAEINACRSSGGTPTMTLTGIATAVDPTT